MCGVWEIGLWLKLVCVGLIRRFELVVNEGDGIWNVAVPSVRPSAPSAP